MNKKFAIIFLCLTVTLTNISRADESPTDLGPYVDNRVDTLHFRAPGGRFNITTGFTMRLHDVDTQSSGGQPNYTFGRSLYALNADVAYGITDNFSAGIGDTFTFNQTLTSTNLTSGVANSQSSTYPSNPTLHLNYRYVGGLTGQFFANGFLDFTPDLGDALLAAGQNVLDIGSNVRYVNGVHELTAIATALYYFSRTYNTANTNNVNSSNGFFAFELEGDYRFHFLQNFYADAFAILNFAHTTSFIYPNQTPVYSVSQSVPFTVTPGLRFGWRAFENVAFYAQYTHQGNTVSSTPNTGTAFSDAQSADLLLIGANIEL